LSSGISSENFVKFQGMLSDTQSSLNSSANSTKFGAGSAVDVMAQIKFSMETGSNGNNTSNISVQLHPKELGKVDISIQLSNDGKTHVMVMAEKTDTLNMLQKESSSLKDMLTDALKTDSGSLNFSFQQSGSDSWRQFANNNSGMISRSSPDLGLLSNEIIMPQGYSYNMTATQGLDIRV
jgi:Flagellar hook-length control protein FliK